MVVKNVHKLAKFCESLSVVYVPSLALSVTDYMGLVSAVINVCNFSKVNK